MAKDSVYECIVIGAGPAGIVTTKELVENGVTNILCLEQESQLGGVFTKSYDSLQLTTSATFSMFSDFFNKDGESNHHWSKQEAVDYWSRYATHFDVYSYVRFNSKVENVIRSEDKQWQVTLSTGDVFYCNRLALSTGNNGLEKYPEWSKELSDIECCHSKNYKNASAFAGKRVLIVGGGESASDLALEISEVADSCWVSLRESAGWIVPRRRGEYASDISTHRGIWGLPRKYGVYITKRILAKEKSRNLRLHDAVVMLNSLIPDPKGIWSTYGTKTFAMAEAVADHGCKVVGEITDVNNGGRNLTSADGVSLDNVDVVVFATGYQNKVRFMPEEYQAFDPRSLYKHMFRLDTRDSLAMICFARPNFGSQFPLMEMQARLFALICSNKAQLPSTEEMKSSVDSDYRANMEQFNGAAERIRGLVDYMWYMDSMAEIIGCKPPLRKYFFRHPVLWLQLIYGPSQATQYRLVGPGSKKEEAHEILKRLPISRFNNIVQMGLKLRVIYAIESIGLLFRRKLSS